VDEEPWVAGRSKVLGCFFGRKAVIVRAPEGRAPRRLTRVKRP